MKNMKVDNLRQVESFKVFQSSIIITTCLFRTQHDVYYGGNKRKNEEEKNYKYKKLLF